MAYIYVEDLSGNLAEKPLAIEGRTGTQPKIIDDIVVDWYNTPNV